MPLASSFTAPAPAKRDEPSASHCVVVPLVPKILVPDISTRAPLAAVRIVAPVIVPAVIVPRLALNAESASRDVAPLTVSVPAVAFQATYFSLGLPSFRPTIRSPVEASKKNPVVADDAMLVPSFSVPDDVKPTV